MLVRLRFLVKINFVFRREVFLLTIKEYNMRTHFNAFDINFNQRFFANAPKCAIYHFISNH